MTQHQLSILKALAEQNDWTSRTQIRSVVHTLKGYAKAMGAPTTGNIDPSTLEGMGYIEHRKAKDGSPIWPLEYRITPAGKESLAHDKGIPHSVRATGLTDLPNTDEPDTRGAAPNVNDEGDLLSNSSRHSRPEDPHMTEETSVATDTDEPDEESNEPIEIGNEPMRVRFQQTAPSVQTLYERYKDGDIVLDPDFQRNFVWSNQKSSNLIESLLLNIPLPLIFTSEFDDDKEEVVDGQQRLTAIFSFLDGRFPDPKGKGEVFRLSKKLKLMAHQIGGKTFKELDKSYQKQIKDHGLQIVCIGKDSQQDVKFEMFERLNTNITPLNAQELRNCLYRGPYNDFLKRMALNDDYRFILNKPTAHARMFDVENVLMFCTFYHRSSDHYTKSLKQTMNEEMREWQSISSAEEGELERQFKKCNHSRPGEERGRGFGGVVGFDGGG